jgi:transformation/transcription domain-associated protein
VSISANNIPNGVNGAGPQQNGGQSQASNSEMEQHLSIFIRDEMTFWYQQSHRSNVKETELRENVQRSSDIVVNKAIWLAKEPDVNNLPASQNVLDSIAKATNPEKLAQTDLLWMPWL